MAQAKFGISQVFANTPLWAKVMFRVTFILTTAICTWVAATNIFPQTSKYEITIFLKLLVDPLMYGISKMFGIQLKEEEKPE